MAVVLMVVIVDDCSIFLLLIVVCCLAYHVRDGIFIVMLLIVAYGRVPSTANALSKHARSISMSMAS